MAKTKKQSMTKTLLSLLLVVPTLFSFIKNLAALIKMEACLAGRSVVNIILLLLIGLCLLASIWFCALALLFVYLISLKLTVILSLGIILLVNLLLLVCVAVRISKCKNTLLFPTTTQHISSLRKN